MEKIQIKRGSSVRIPFTQEDQAIDLTSYELTSKLRNRETDALAGTFVVTKGSAVGGKIYDFVMRLPDVDAAALVQNVYYSFDILFDNGTDKFHSDSIILEIVRADTR